MTLSSFTTLSLSPDPIISFNIRTNDSDPSRTLSALEYCHVFLIHILDDSAEGARIADVFTKGGDYMFGKEGFGLEGVFEIERQPYGTQEGEHLPKLSGKGVGKVLFCEVLQDGVSLSGQPDHGGEMPQTEGMGFIRVRDHVLVIARVHEVLGDVSDSESWGLSYLDGKYRRAGRILPLEPTEKSRSR